MSYGYFYNPVQHNAALPTYLGAGQYAMAQYNGGRFSSYAGVDAFGGPTWGDAASRRARLQRKIKEALAKGNKKKAARLQSRLRRITQRQTSKALRKRRKGKSLTAVQKQLIKRQRQQQKRQKAKRAAAKRKAMAQKAKRYPGRKKKIMAATPSIAPSAEQMAMAMQNGEAPGYEFAQLAEEELAPEAAAIEETALQALDSEGMLDEGPDIGKILLFGGLALGGILLLTQLGKKKKRQRRPRPHTTGGAVARSSAA